MKTPETLEKKILKEEKKVWRQLELLHRHEKHTPGHLKQFRIVQSVNAGHIRGGHAFH
jgi:hypothetical protein